MSKTAPRRTLWTLLDAALILSITSDLTWIASFIISTNSSQWTIVGKAIGELENLVGRVAWIGTIGEYLCLTLFAQWLAANTEYKWTAHNVASIGLAIMLTAAWLLGIVLHGPHLQHLDDVLCTLVLFFFIPFTVIPTIIGVHKYVSKGDMPKLLRGHLSTFLWRLLLPKFFIDLITDVIINNHFEVVPQIHTYLSMRGLASIPSLLGSLITIWATYISAKKMLGMRFLNSSDQVKGNARFTFIDDIKRVLSELGQVSTIQELHLIIKKFYEQCFQIPLDHTQLIVFTSPSEGGGDAENDQSMELEALLSDPHIKKLPILVRDELEFSRFYEPSDTLSKAIDILNLVKADIILPIYDKKRILGCIIVFHNARPERFYKSSEYDEMLVFNNYLGALIHLLKTRNIDALVQLEKELKEELYIKHQEIKHYKEALRDYNAKYHADSERLQQMRHIIKDPTDWDMALFLETTQTGRLINKIIPGTGAQIIDFKLALLRAAMSNKAVLLQVPEEDLAPTAELLHHIGGREHLEVFECSQVESNHEYALQFFGIHPLYGKEQSTGLFERLDTHATVLIKHIEHLSLSTQDLLAQMLNSGTFCPLKSDRKCTNYTRIMCYTSAPIDSLVAQGTISKKLHTELIKTTASLPSLLTLEGEDLENLAESIAQHLKQDTYDTVGLTLNQRERTQILKQRPVSLKEYKTRVYNVLAKKAKHHAVNPEQALDGAYVDHGPELYHVAKLGKQALKDRQIMIFLWNKFKNQTKIAKILNVNRSSVNRRCKEFNLM